MRVSEINPRYFTDNTGKAIYLTGSHTWNNLVDMEEPGQSNKFDYTAYLEFLKTYNHNFFRLWAWDLLNWDVSANNSKDSIVLFVSPKPWVRCGPGQALDSLPKFDLTQFNEAYFTRLKDRVSQAQASNMYVAVMLFEGWGTQFSPKAFENHPFYPSNNINGIAMDTSHDSLGVRIYELGNKGILELQQHYVKKVVETVNKFNNVIYEISNENHPESTEWQFHMINYIRELESKMSKQHPIGMTFQWKGGFDQTLFDSPADWISPGKKNGYPHNPPPNDGQKVIISDTDHLWGIGGYRQWVWKSFLRGLNPIFMDPYDHKVLDKGKGKAWEEQMNAALGYSRTIADKVDLIHMIPDTSIVSSRYCLSNSGEEYLIYVAEGIETSFDLTAASGTFNVVWFNPIDGKMLEGNPINGGSKQLLSAPFEAEDVVIHVKKQD